MYVKRIHVHIFIIQCFIRNALYINTHIHVGLCMYVCTYESLNLSFTPLLSGVLALKFHEKKKDLKPTELGGFRSLPSRADCEMAKVGVIDT